MRSNQSFKNINRKRGGRVLNHWQLVFKVKGGHDLIRRWYKRWDGSVESLRKSSGDRRSIFTNKEKKVHIKNFIDKRAKSDPVGYPEVKEHVECKTGKV